MSEMFNTIDRKTWQEIKETLQWPPMENQLVVYTQTTMSFSYLNKAWRIWACRLNVVYISHPYRDIVSSENLNCVVSYSPDVIAVSYHQSRDRRN